MTARCLPDKKGQSGAHGRKELPRSEEDPIKAESARIFMEKYHLAKNDATYQELMARHREMYERSDTDSNNEEPDQTSTRRGSAQVKRRTGKRKLGSRSRISDKFSPKRVT
jgi:uncharacterized protein YceH (UPF0502 family)